MKEQACSNHSILATAVLSSFRVLDILKDTGFGESLHERDLREAVYLTYQPWAARQPDHIFEHSWKWLLNGQDGRSIAPDWVAMSLRVIANEFIEFRHGAAKIRLNKFGAWQQSILSRVGGLPIQAAAAVTDRGWTSTSHRQKLIEAAGTETLHGMITPYDAAVEDYIVREGLHETHLHLNGSTHAELCWLRALYNPVLEVKDFDKKWKSLTNPHAEKLRELVHAVNPQLTPSELSRQLRVAAQLRRWLCTAAIDYLSDDLLLPAGYNELANGLAPIAPELPHAYKLSPRTDRADELRWLTMLVERLQEKPSAIIARMLHLYLVLQNQYYRLLVQSEEQYGFDQFQKLTYTDLREPTERDYYQRFVSMHGDEPVSSRVVFLEGRFAPKDSLPKNRDLLQSILTGYLQYLEDGNVRLKPTSLSKLLDALDATHSSASFIGRRHRLALVAHFIKLPWSGKPEHKAGPYRFYPLRKEVEKKASLLLQTVKRWPKLQNWLRGIDAAANELHAPPEVFASAYRICKNAGFTRRSYHVGEDFPHLISGLRHMMDAIELLDLQNGDRLGHGTAMGICPKLWVDRMPGKLILKKGEWLLDLLVIWQMLRQIPEETAEAYRVEGLLSNLSGEIFQNEISCAALGRAMQFRGLNIRFLMESRSSSWVWDSSTFSDLWATEAKRVADAQRTNPDDLKILIRWLSDSELWSRSEDLIEVETAFFSEQTFVRLQQVVMRRVRDAGVVVETLPSSNVRISQYLSFTEHHALRWIRVPGYARENDPEIMVSLGSDDPGIFAGDLNGEFYQLYAALRSLGLGDASALSHLAPLNERGRQYRFHAARIA